MPINIAFADDHVLVRKGFVSLAQSFNELNTVAEADNGDDLIAIITGSKHIPDVCIIDIRMPVLNGFETLLAIKSHWPTIKVLMLTMYDNEFNMLKFLHGGAEGYLLKDASSEDFLNSIVHIYNGGLYYPAWFLKKVCIAIGDRNEKKYISLTNNEFDFLSLCATELTLKEIATRMSSNLRTVEGYRDALFVKLNIHSRVGLALYSLRSGIEVDNSDNHI